MTTRGPERSTGPRQTTASVGRGPAPSDDGTARIWNTAARTYLLALTTSSRVARLAPLCDPAATSPLRALEADGSHAAVITSSGGVGEPRPAARP
jgi:hypothetical protein